MHSEIPFAIYFICSAGALKLIKCNLRAPLTQSENNSDVTVRTRFRCCISDASWWRLPPPAHRGARDELRRHPAAPRAEISLQTRATQGWRYVDLTRDVSASCGDISSSSSDTRMKVLVLSTWRQRLVRRYLFKLERLKDEGTWT